jgi:hypothetical protein
MALVGDGFGCDIVSLISLALPSTMMPKIECHITLEGPLTTAIDHYTHLSIDYLHALLCCLRCSEYPLLVDNLLSDYLCFAFLGPWVFINQLNMSL